MTGRRAGCGVVTPRAYGDGLVTTELYLDPTYPRFTREDLVAEMRERFSPFSDGTFRKYQDLGLVAAGRQDHRWPTGAGGGSAPALWSDHDRRMLMAVLELRDRHAREVDGQLELAKLGNFIVWSWVYWDGFVELDQARRALRTWVWPQLGGRGGRARSEARVHRLARQLVDQVAAPGVRLKDRKRVAGLLAARLWKDDLDGLRALVGDLRSVMDPEGTGRFVGAPGACVDAAGEIEKLYITHRGAQAVVTGDPPLPDADWHWARALLRQGWAGYSLDQQQLADSATDPAMFPEPSVDYQLARASSSLLMVLGSRVTEHR